ncbi:MAG TPA: hypothetical protein PKC23_12505 [Candidatus Desulfobacillus sp.]|nr:hypothetical protein [Candidatus Desulfobacillus sp.]
MPEIATLSLQGEVAVVTVDNPPVNSLAGEVRQVTRPGLPQIMSGRIAGASLAKWQTAREM